ncbi:unnamed protein product [Linum tenue]|uniref:RING-type domain-containing protein n=1 Tax=Linum tenue TaxID=586396 RepID=A0AAV0L0G8_9ROSI|nr:unnamed protein product [Linum tenue]
MERNSFRNLQRPKFIADNFNSLNQVISALREAGLESSNLILGVDFTKSNEWSGRYSFHRKSLHAVGSVTNPYEQAISIIGRTLSPFDEDNLIPCFGFGDVSTRDEYVFSFYPDHRPCRGFEEALARYREIIPHLQLSGSLVTRNPGIPRGSCSPQEQATLNSIVAASYYPLSIVLVGVGDGPWDAMKQFDDNIPHRAFDNFQFVNFTKIMSEKKDTSKKEADFALAALMEIPLQYRATQSLDVSGRSTTGHPLTKPLPPPKAVIDHDDAIRSIPPLINSATTGATAAPVEPVCPICWTNPKNMAFGCGHTTCQECGGLVTNCPLCRQPITTRIKLFN